MHDLLYSDELSSEIIKKLKNAFPDIKMESSYDDIHGGRVSIDIDELQRREYLKWIIRNGWDNISFYIQMTVNAPKFRIKDDTVNANISELQGIITELTESPKKS